MRSFPQDEEWGRGPSAPPFFQSIRKHYRDFIPGPQGNHWTFKLSSHNLGGRSVNNRRGNPDGQSSHGHYLFRDPTNVSTFWFIQPWPNGTHPSGRFYR